MKPEGRWWKSADNGRVKCLLCPRGCVIPPGGKGVCRVRGNVDGRLVCVGYGELVSLANDPIEKKPLYHFYPGSYIISVACNGCNLKCAHCQNYQISQMECPTRYFSPEELVEVALRYSSIGICFTYTEPLVWFEYIIDVARIAKREGLFIVLVSNGQINPDPLKELLPFVDAANIDLKSIEDSFYRDVCGGGSLEATLNCIREAYASGVHVEVTNLIIPGLNDVPDQIERLVEFLTQVSVDIPLHFTRFFPHYRMTDRPPTPISTLLKAKAIAESAGMKFVYVGNVGDERLNSTYCPKCKRLLVRRSGFFEVVSYLEKGRCPSCGEPVYGRF